MVRKIWIASLLVAFTGGSFSLVKALASQPVQSVVKERTITVNEDGKAPRKCKVLKEWTTLNGNRAFQVEALDNGEYMTVEVMKGNNSSKIYHWTNKTTPPQNSPRPTDNPVKTDSSRTVEARPAIRNNNDLPMQTAVNSQKESLPLSLPTFNPTNPSGKADEFVTIPAPGADKVAVTEKSSKPPLVALPVKKVDSKVEIPVVTKPSSSGSVNPARQVSQDKVVVIKEEKTLLKTEEGKEKIISITPLAIPKPVEKVVLPQDNSKPVSKAEVVTGKNPEKKLVSNDIKVVEKPVSNKTVKVEDKAAEKKSVDDGKTIVVENPKPQDWRKSWGRMEESEPKTIFKPNKNSDSELPHADSKKSDPLKSPDKFHPTLEEKVARKAEKVMGKDNGQKELEKITTKQPVKTNAEMAEQQLPRTVVPTPGAKKNTSEEKIVVIKEDIKPKNNYANRTQIKSVGTEFIDKAYSRLGGLRANKKAPEPKPGMMPPGTRSILASGYEGQMINPLEQSARNTMNLAFMPSPMPPTNPPQAPQLYPANNYQYAVNIPPRAPTQGMANAFTNVPNQRPIPSDMEGITHMHNAFQQPAKPEVPFQLANPQAMSYAMAIQGQRPLQPITSPQNQTVASGVTEQLVVIKTSLHPSQREMAAEQLGQYALRANGEIVLTLVQCAKNDPAPTVRAACIRSLARMKINTIEAMDFLNGMKTMDQDPRVRKEAENAVLQLTSGSR